MIGGVFIIIMISTAITYSALSMEQITQAAETVEAKQTIDFQKTTEEFEIVKIQKVNEQFNMTVSNTGDIPVHLTRLWVENTTDSTWPIAKYDIDEIIPSGGSVYNIGQNIGLAALDTQSYEMKLVSERGNTEKMLLNSVGEESLYLNLRATPTIVATGFTSTLVLEVINTGSNKLVNLQAEMDSVSEICASCSYDLVSAVSPTSFDSLSPGDIATFEWVYTVDGTTDGDNLTFTASLVNGVDEATAVVTIKVVETAETSNISFETGALASDATVADSRLIFHAEQTNVPNGGYQLMSVEPDGGIDGTRLASNGTGLPLSPISFMTTNGSSTVTIPVGKWNATVWIDSAEDPITTGSPGYPDIKYHMEDGDGVNPDNSRTSSTGSDLTECGGAGWCSLGSAICDTNWDNRFEITIDNTKVAGSGDHSDFPMLVHISGADFTNYLDDGNDSINDIRFTSDAGVLLDYEIEKFSQADDELIAWVEVPTLEWDQDTIIYMYFDNAQTSGYGDEQQAAGTWNTNYKMVQHMNEDPSVTAPQMIDSTSNNNDATSSGSMTSGDVEAGKVGDSIDFDGSNDFIYRDMNSIPSSYSIEAWIFATSAGVAIAEQGQQTPQTGWHTTLISFTGTNTINVGHYDGSHRTLSLGSTYSTSTWYHVALTYDAVGDVLRGYVNGVEQNSLSSTAKQYPSDWWLALGANANPSTPGYWTGNLDEVFVSDNVRSAGWITTTYNTQNSPSTFYSLTLEGGGGGNPPDWQEGQGPHGSGAYHYDGVDECHRTAQAVSSGNTNDIAGNDAATSLWFKTDGVDLVDSEQMLVFWEGTGTYPSSHYYKMSLGSAGDGRLLFEFDADDTGTGTTSCLSANEYDKEIWYNAIGVRDESDNSCDLYIYNLSGTLAESVITGTQTGSGETITHDGGDKMYVGSRAETDDWFKGWIDDVFHWNTVELDSTDAQTIARVNHGTAAHKFDVFIDVHDTDGNWLRNEYTLADQPLPYHDPKHYTQATDDLALGQYTIAMPNVPQISVTSVERLNFTMAFQQASNNWEPLKMGLKLDDEDISPQTSYLEIPLPDNPFASYLSYDQSEQLTLFVTNTGEDGIYFVYSGTRISFDDGTNSYASHIRYVNGTSNPYAVDVDSDSIYIPSGDKAEMIFYNNPSDHPCGAQTCQDANIIPDGTYRMASWINGYTDQGESFGRSVLLGSVTVED